MNQTGKLLLKWIKKGYEKKYSDPEVCLELSKKVCREYWDRYGEKVIKKAINHTSCTSRRKFEELCESFKEL